MKDNEYKQARYIKYKEKTEEDIKILFENDRIKIEKIRSYGVISGKDSWYDNNCDEWVCVAKGEAVLEFENEKIRLKAAENYYIKSHVKHRVDYTSKDCEWFCVYIK